MKFMEKYHSYLKDDRGQGMVEYVLLVSLIAMVVIAALLLLGPAISQGFNNIVDAVNAL